MSQLIDKEPVGIRRLDVTCECRQSAVTVCLANAQVYRSKPRNGKLYFQVMIKYGKTSSRKVSIGAMIV